MKRINILLVLALAMITLGLAGNAQAQRWDWDNDNSVAQFRSFDAFMNQHPWIAKKLWERPQRVNDRDFVKDNKELKQWLEDHPAAAEAFHGDPAGFMERESHFQRYGGDFAAADAGRGELARFDWFLDGHRDIRRDLMRRPELIDNHGYLDHHHELQEFLRHHPGLRAELQEHPREFMEREGRY